MDLTPNFSIPIPDTEPGNLIPQLRAEALAIDSVVSAAGFRISVKSRGAIGNGVADDTTAFDTAISDAASIGASVYVPPGTYKHTAGHSLSGISNVAIFGDGWNSVIDQRGGDFIAFYAHNCAKITIDHLRFLGDFDTLASPVRASQKAVQTDNAVAAGTTVGLSVSYCYFDNLSGDAIRLGPNTLETSVIGNKMSGGLGFLEMSGLDVGGDYRPVRGVSVLGNNVKGSVSSPRTSGPTADGYTITGSDDLVDAYGGASQVTIIGNTFDGGDSRTSSTTTVVNNGIIVPAQGGQGPSHSWTITGNTFRNFPSIHAAGYITTGGVQLVTNGLANTRVSNNIFYNVKNGVAFVDTTATGLAAEHNVVDTCRVGIYVGNAAAEVSVVGNTVKFPTDIAIYMNGDRISCTHNKVFLDSTLTGNKTGLYSTTGDQKLIQSNFVTGGPSGCYLIRVVAGNDTRVFDNLAVGSSGTGLSIGSGALRAHVRNNFLSGNSTDYSNGETTTLFEDTTNWPGATLKIAGTQVIQARETGWTAGTGTANKGAFAAYAGATMSATYVQAEAQATNDAAKNNSQRVKAIEDCLRTHGLIN